MKRTIVVILALVAVFFLCRGGPARPPAEHPAVRSARIELPPHVAAQLSKMKLAPISSDAAFVVRGVVETPNGVPIAGASVAARSLDREAFAATTADRDGSYELVVREGEMFLEVEAPGFAHASAFLYATGVHEKRFQLVVGGALRGRVVRADGVPCAAATVRVMISERAFEEFADADATGAFTIASLPPGDVTISAHGPGCMTRRATELVLELGQTVDDVEVRAERGYAVSGLVVDETTQRPIARARVEGVPNARVASTDAGGRFVIHGLPADEVSIFVTSQGLEGRTAARIVDSDVEVRIALAAPPPEVPPLKSGPGKPFDVIFVFEDPSGIPVPLTHVSLTLETGEVRDGITDVDGGVWFTDVPVGSDGEVRVEGRRMLDGADHKWIAIHGPTYHLVMRPADLHPAAPIRGHVLDADGKPAANIFIASSAHGGPAYETVSRADGSFEVGTAWDAPHEITATSAHADLTAKVHARPGETVTVRLERRFHVELRVTRDGAPVDDFVHLCKIGDRWLTGMSLHAGRLRSTEAGPLSCDVFSEVGSGTGKIVVAHGGPNVLAIALAANATITGRVVSQTGAPMASMPVAVHGPYDYNDSLPFTDANGRFVITGVPAGATVVEVVDVTTKLTTSPGARVDVGDVRVPY